jgi:hypothetical protein
MDNKTNGNTGGGRIEALKEREREIRARIAAEQVRMARRKQKVNAKLFALVGETLTQYAAQSPDFQLMLKQVLQTAVTDERSREFLKGQGWL